MLTRAGEAGPWQQPFADHRTTGLGRVWFNPWGNLELLEKSWIERAADELENSTPAEARSFCQRETFRMLSNMVRRRMLLPLEDGAAGRAAYFEFRITTDSSVLFTSPLLELRQISVP